ncbi:restriction endonuclease subunit S [Nitrococcus mobilis]|uniref:Type I restriction-modification system, S subunit n=1 Tax=Nitrococcus mobilis Nb-231 TaxID=314278 RepID=A4BRK5_9GAMM|nr:restriction endonuclease subunit S [Nitrococcus mobilis]EAR21576.1 type I restriction-modification system, S subunit [Nitrococcus mobilis Nb-231]
MSATTPARPEQSRRKPVEGHSIALCEHLPLIAAAPGGIKKLRELILDLAVRGKLVPQNPNDEPASELLECIDAEKRQLITEGKLKKGRAQQGITAGNQPFGLPPRWRWSRLGGLALLVTDGTHHTPQYVAKGVPFISVKDISGGQLRFSDTKFISQEEHQTISSRCNPERNDILLCRIGTLGKPVIVDTDQPFSLFVSVGLIKTPKSTPITRWTKLVLESPLMLGQYEAIKAGGSHTNKLNLGDIPKLMVPLPPLAGQARIVAKVDELMALCDRLEAQQADTEAAHTTLVKTLLDTLTQSRSAEDFAANWQRLSAHFDTLFTTEPSIDTLKQTLLQLAVMGKLVPQDPSDGPASELLKRLRGRNGNRQVGRRTNEEALPALPAGWECVSVGDLGPIAGGATPNKGDASLWSGTIPWVSPKDMKRSYINDAVDHVSAVAIEKTSLKLIPAGSLLLVVRGMILAHSFPVAISQVPLCINQDMKAISLLPEMAEFVLYALQGLKPHILQLIERSSHGTCKLKSETLFGHPFPLPPLAEQHRIVAKVDELMVLCDRLKARLAHCRIVHGRLADALAQVTAA